MVVLGTADNRGVVPRRESGDDGRFTVINGGERSGHDLGLLLGTPVVIGKNAAPVIVVEFQGRIGQGVLPLRAQLSEGPSARTTTWLG